MSFLMAEYICPIHGRFDALVERDANGEAPDVVECRETVMVDAASITDLYMPGTAEMPFPCGEPSHWAISAPLGRVKIGEVSQGKVAKAERHTWLDTEQLADRGAWKEWKKKRTEMWHSHYQDRRKKKGLDVASFKAAKEHGK